MTAYYRPTPNVSIKAAGLASWASGLAAAGLYAPDAWTLLASAQALTQTVLSGAAGLVPAGIGTSGFFDACPDGSGGFWAVQQAGSLGHLTAAGTASTLTLPPQAYRGLSYVSGFASPYALDSSGRVITVVAGVSAAVTPQLSGRPAIGLATSGTSLFALIPAASSVAFLSLTSVTGGTSGSLLTPMDTPACVAAQPGAVAVGGTALTSFASGASGLAISPQTGASLLGAVPSAGAVVVYANASGSWSRTGAVTGLGAVTAISWQPDGLRALAAAPTANQVRAFTFSLGTLTLTQTLTVLAATQCAVTASGVALVAQGAQNAVLPLTIVGTGWVASGSSLPVGGPLSVASLGASAAVVGCTSGLVSLSLSSGGTWSVGSSAALPFVPTSLYIDPVASGIYAVGTSGAAGWVAWASSALTVQASASWAGAACGVTYLQGQVAVGDPTVNALRVFDSTLVQQASAAAPAGVASLAIGQLLFGTVDLFAGGSAATWEYRFGAPFTLNRSASGVVAVYASGSWSSAVLGTDQTPMAVAFDPSGRVSVATLQNTLYTINVTGGVGSSGMIAQFGGQSQSTPIGLSRLLWASGHLWGATSLNDSLVQVL